MKITKIAQRNRRKARIRSQFSGTAARPRLSVYRSLNNISAQLIDDAEGRVIIASSTLSLKKKATVDNAREVGKDLAKKALAKKIEQCVFDRNGFLYHGRVKALADGAREGGLKF
jgi:large subunit ribosomal protein L18